MVQLCHSLRISSWTCNYHWTDDSLLFRLGFVPFDKKILEIYSDEQIRDNFLKRNCFQMVYNLGLQLRLSMKLFVVWLLVIIGASVFCLRHVTEYGHHVNVMSLTALSIISHFWGQITMNLDNSLQTLSEIVSNVQLSSIIKWLANFNGILIAQNRYNRGYTFFSLLATAVTIVRTIQSVNFDIVYQLVGITVLGLIAWLIY